MAKTSKERLKYSSPIAHIIKNYNPSGKRLGVFKRPYDRYLKRIAERYPGRANHMFFIRPFWFPFQYLLRFHKRGRYNPSQPLAIQILRHMIHDERYGFTQVEKDLYLQVNELIHIDDLCKD